MRRVSHELTMPHKQRDASAFGEGTINHAKLIPAYSLTARVLHWITAFLILTMIPLGLVIANEWGGFAQDALYNLHRSIGVTIIPLVILRIVYRWTHPPLPLPADIAPMQRFAAHAPPPPIARLSRCLACSSCRRSGRSSAHCPSNCSSFMPWSASRSLRSWARMWQLPSIITSCAGIASSCA